MGKLIIVTEEMEAFIRANYLLMSSKQLADNFNVSRYFIQRWLRRNGLVVPHDVVEMFGVKAMTGRTNFTAEDDEHVIAHYLTKPIKTLAAEIGRSYTGVMMAIKRLGLVLPQEIIQRNKNSSYFKEGQEPENKGKPMAEWMSADSIARSAVTRLKKGNIPHNAYKSNGVVTLRNDKNGTPYYYIRVSLGKWVPLHRYNYERFIGDIPDGYLVCFKDGDTMNCHPFNLELLSMVENAIRNGGTVALTDKVVARYLATTSRKIDKELVAEYLKHPDLLALKRSEYLLTREIRKHERK